MTVTLPASGSTSWYPWAQDVTTAVNSGTGSGVPTTRAITAGAGLSGGGDLSADRTLAVTYGTTAGTAAQGNDSRITGAVQNAAGVGRIQVITAAAYAALGTKVSDTLYVIVG